MHSEISLLRSVVKRYGFFAIALPFFASTILAQVSENVSKVTVGTVQPGKPLGIELEFVQSAVYEKVEIAYRQFGQRDYRRKEMLLTSNLASIDIPAKDLETPLLEYYFILYKKTAPTPETFPLDNAEENPLRINLHPAEAERRDINILSPEHNEHLNSEDLLISFLLTHSDSSLDKAATRTYVDNIDISSTAVITEDLYVVHPENSSLALTSGSHTIRVELFDRQGKPLSTYSWKFFITGIGAGTLSEPVAQWTHNGSLQLETRNENIASQVTPYNRATMSGASKYKEFRFVGRAFVTNEEKDNRQPQNRFFIGAESPWLKVGYGDAYPAFPDLLMNGKRVRGITGNLTLGAFNLDISNGDILRRVASDTVKTFPFDSLTIEQSRDPSGAYGPYDTTCTLTRWAKFRYGSFDRGIFVFRPSFGPREASHIGFTYLKSFDDVGSIRYGIRPQENVAVGSDFLLTFDSRRIEIAGLAAFSATNVDITGGTFTDADIDSIYKEPNYSESDRKNIRDARDVLRRFITANEHLDPLSLKDLSTLAYETRVSLNYFKNNFLFSFLRHGNNFESFGQTFLRRDVVGFNTSDRLPLFANRMIVLVGLERLKDNTAETKAATTTYTTFNTAVSYSSRSDFPNVTLGYLHAANKNTINTDSASSVSDKTNRVFVQIGREITLGVRHNASLGFSTSVRDDRTKNNLDNRNTAVTLSNITTYKIPLQTVVSLTVNSTKFSFIDTTGTSISTTKTYTTVYANAQYRLMEDKLRLIGLVSPTFGEIKRTLVDFAAQYYLLRNFNARGQVSLYFNNQRDNDFIFSLVLSLDV